MTRWAGWLLVVYGSAHTLAALTLERAATHAGDWFSGALWGQDLSRMSDANAAYWLSINSFGPPLVLIGAIVLWACRHGITPPPFIGWAVAAWTAIDAAVSGPTPWPVAAVAAALLVVGSRRTERGRSRTPT